MRTLTLRSGARGGSASLGTFSVPAILKWFAVASERRRLAALDDRTLADIGLTRDQAMAEAAKPFWKSVR